jgi:hypothetical protein
VAATLPMLTVPLCARNWLPLAAVSGTVK